MSTDTTQPPETDVADLQYAPSNGLRAQLVPVGIGLAVGLAATILWGIRSASSPVPTLATIAVIAAGALVLARTSKAARYAIATAALWAAMWSTWGASWFLTALGATLIGLCGIPWWRARYIPNHGATDTPVLDSEPEMPDELAAAAEILDNWAAYVAKEGPLQGVRLAFGGTDGRAYRFKVCFQRGKHTYTQLVGQRAQIVSALDVPDPDVIIERGSTGAHARLTVIVDDSERPPAMYPGPRFDPATGLVGFSLYDDTRAEAYLSIVDDNGVFGATFCGDQGTGKSACMAQVVLSLLASGYFVGVYVDPQGSMSSPMLAEACTWTATSVEEASAVVRALPRWRRLRQIRLLRDGRDGYTLSRERPALLVIMDEFQELANGLTKSDQKILVGMAKTLRKVGGALFVGTQTIGVESFGGNNDLRTQLMSRNVVYFYSSSKQQGHLSGSNEFDPSTLPNGTPGYGYVKELRVKGKVITRAAPIRSYFFGRDIDHGGINAGLAWYRRLRQTHTFATLPADEVGAFGAAFANREADRAAADANDDEFLAACEAVGRGMLDPARLDEIENRGQKTTTQTAEPGLPSLRLGGPQPEETEPADEYPEKTQAVINALRAGAWRTVEITAHAARAGITISTSLVETRLREFVETGQAVRVETGHYHAPSYETNCGHPRCKG